MIGGEILGGDCIGSAAQGLQGALLETDGLNGNADYLKLQRMRMIWSHL
jgi:hypothetical protein